MRRRELARKKSILRIGRKSLDDDLIHIKRLGTQRNSERSRRTHVAREKKF